MTSSTNGIRLGGLISGFDTQGIIEQILSVEQSRIDELTDEKEINTAKIDTWGDIALQLKELAEAATKLKSDGIGGNNLFDNKSVSSTASTVATATATSDASTGSYNLSVTQLAQGQVIYGSQQSDGWTLPADGSVILNGATISLTTGDSLDDIATKITAGTYASGEELEAMVIDNRLVIQTKNKGSTVSIYGTSAPGFTVGTDDPDNILRAQLGLINGGGNILNESQEAQDAEFTFNGISIARSDNVVSDIIDDVTFTLTGAGSTTINIAHDTKEIKETITEFVDLYNETRDFIDRTRNAKLDEEDQFGLFFSDPLMRELYNDIRSMTTGGVKMGGAEWDGTVLVNGAASLGATSLTLDGFSNATGTLNKGDQIVLSGDTTVYTLLADATVSGNAATILIDPPLKAAASDNTSLTVAIRTMEDFGVGVRTDTVSGTQGILGILDEGKLDSALATDIELVKRIFTRYDTTTENTGVARRLYDWIDRQTKISSFASFDRAIDDIKIDSITDTNTRLDEQIARLEERLAQKEEALIAQFSRMESAMAEAQSAGAALSGFGGGGQQNG